MEPFITISAQPGSGGRELGRIICSELDARGEPGWRVLDEEIAREAVEDPRLHIGLDELLREEFHSEFEDFVAQFIERCSPQSEVIDRVFHVVRKEARAGRAVIIGRAAVCVTRGLHLGLHLRLVASEKTRLDRLVRLLGVSKDEARKAMQKRERWRAALMRRYYLSDIENPLLYDVVFNADRSPMTDIARGAVGMMQDKVRRLEKGTISA